MTNHTVTTPTGSGEHATPVEPPRHRARWAAIGAAVAVSFGAGAASLPIADAVTSSGERTVYTAITPCRLADFRPEFQVGPRDTPLGAGETETIAARGAQGDCSAAQLPVDAVALQLNVTALDATLPTFLAITPDGSTGTSSLNPVPGAPPTPNGLTVDLAADGTFKVFNLQGDVNVFFDVTGFYTDHDHDDRYYTKTELDDRLDELKVISLQTARDYFNETAIRRRGPIRFQSSLVLPADYTPGTAMRLQVHYFSSGPLSACSVQVIPDFFSAYRTTTNTFTPGLGTRLDTGLAEFTLDTTDTLSFSAGDEALRTVRATLDSPENDDLMPGDVVNFGFFSANDTCGDDVGTYAAALYYE
ncbi:MAG: hypothetical protein AAFP84_19680 [Actinomycetota bacterium]